MHSIEFTPEALDDLAWLRRFDQARVMSELESQLIHDATVESRNRKRLRPNKLSESVLRVDRFRVYYDAFSESGIVRVVAIGEKKGSKLFIRGEEYEL
ncbi:MAG: type II toxin-antitoxin system RelE/ParE family toxin [Planctomycetes bacterium]|nr:type II toxin-antitoxin system RelE/ParE family toxin [Planctomycetota bacterium]